MRPRWRYASPSSQMMDPRGLLGSSKMWMFIKMARSGDPHTPDVSPLDVGAGVGVGVVVLDEEDDDVAVVDGVEVGGTPSGRGCVRD